MSALMWRRILCVICTVLGVRVCLCASPAEESNGIIRKTTGESVTIHCISSDKNEEYLDLVLFQGLHEEVKVAVIPKAGDSSINPTVHALLKTRFQVNGEFPELHMTITNLTVEDTGVYWCIYEKLNNYRIEMNKGTGHILLIVTSEVPHVPTNTKDRAKECDDSPKTESTTLILVCALTFTVFLFLVGILVWFICKMIKYKKATKKSKQDSNGNDLYEEMHATLRL